MNMSMAVPAVDQLTNREGAQTFRRSLKEQLIQVLTTNTLGNTFYVDRHELRRETMEVIYQAVREIPEFVGKALVYARNRALLKKVPTIGLVALSGIRGNKQPFLKSFAQVILIPDDLRTFVSECESGKITGRKGFGGCSVDPVRDWLNGLSEYHAVKYGSVNSKGKTLRDIIRLAHPKPATAALQERFSWLTKGWSEIGPDPSPTNPMIWGLERLKRATDEEEAIRLITDYRLPYEVVVPSVKSMTPKIWEALMKVAPYFNLLRNLNNFAKQGLFDNEANVEYVASRLTDSRAILKSKILPFRFFDAFKAYTREFGYKQKIADAISTALDLSFVNMPEFPKGTRIAVGVDVSGSMKGPISDQGALIRRRSVSHRQEEGNRFIDIASIFAAAMLKKSQDTVLLPFDDDLHIARYASSDSMMSIARKIARLGGGGTSLGLPIEHLTDRKIRADAFIGITDNEDWAYGRGYSARGSFLDAWRQYRQLVNPDAKAFLITIAPYRDAVAPKDETNVHFIYGWSEAVAEYIPRILESGSGQIEEIEGIEL